MRFNTFLNERKFAVKKELCPDIWKGDKIDETLRKKLIRIAKDFYEDLELDTEIIDIQLTGSIANYNYTVYSDIDVHIIIDFSEIDDNVALVKKSVDGPRFIWNLRHNIVLRNHDIELYVQDQSEAHVSSGVYSLLNDEWIVKPEFKQPNVDTKEIALKYHSIVDEINRLEKLSKEELTPEDSEDFYNYAKDLKSKIMKGRKEGLAANGEFSIENLVFKKLRNESKLEKIINLTSKFYDNIYAQQD